MFYEIYSVNEIWSDLIIESFIQPIWKTQIYLVFESHWMIH